MKIYTIIFILKEFNEINFFLINLLTIIIIY